MSTKKQKGQAVVETAILLPVLLGLSFMMVDAGRGFSIQNAMNAAVRDEARMAAVDPRFSPSYKAPEGQTVDSMRTQAVREIHDRLFSKLNLPEKSPENMIVTVTIPGWNGAPGNLQEDPIVVRVDRSLPLLSTAALPAVLGANQVTLHAVSSAFAEIGRAVLINPELLNQDNPDIDGDGIANSKDPDIDGDGVPNEQDYNPYDPTVQYPSCRQDHSSPACTQADYCQYYQEGCTSDQNCQYFNQCTDSDQRCAVRNECTSSDQVCKMRNYCETAAQRCLVRNECSSDALCALYDQCESAWQRCVVRYQCESADQLCYAHKESCTDSDQVCRVWDNCQNDVQRCQVRNECSSDANCYLYNQCVDSDQRCRMLNQCTSSDQRCLDRNECADSTQRCLVRNECTSDIQRCQVRNECTSDANCQLYNQCTSSDQRCLDRGECTAEQQCRLLHQNCTVYEG